MGKKDPSRKRPRRKPRVRRDADLDELAAVLDSSRQEPSLEALFGPPWRDGWNAVVLTNSCWVRFHTVGGQHPHRDLAVELQKWHADRRVSAMLYELAEASKDHLLNAIHDPADYFLAAGLRCIQLIVSNSHGGGEGYNAALRRAFASAQPEWLVEAGSLIDWFRCEDAIGTTPMLRNDANDRIRNAFSIAWSRGLYTAAYALPRVS